MHSLGGKFASALKCVEMLIMAWLDMVACDSNRVPKTTTKRSTDRLHQEEVRRVAFEKYFECISCIKPPSV